MDCIFCKISDKKINANIRYEDEFLLAFDDIYPKAPIHILIIPKKHIATLNEANKDDIDLLGKMMLNAKTISKELNIAENGYRIIMNCNQDGGQEIFHIHLHLLGGKKLIWPNQ